MNNVSGLHSCKPGNEPVSGQVKTFVIEQRTGKNNKPYTKIRSAAAEAGGQPYKIMAVKPTGHTDSYGNISFNLDIEPAGAQESTAPRTQAPPARQNGGGWSDDRSNRIERQHSQEMAIRYFAQRGGLKGGKEGREELRIMIDWFQRDIGHEPTAPSKREQQLDGDPSEYGDGSPEEPF